MAAQISMVRVEVGELQCGTILLDAEREFAIQVSRRRDCHFADITSPSLLRRLLHVEGRAAE